MRAEDLLILNFGGFNRRLDALYERLVSDAALREYFVADPGAVLDATVFRNFQRTPPNRVNQFNRALYSVLSNKDFVAWGGEFQKRIIAEARGANPDLDDDWQALRAIF